MKRLFILSISLILIISLVGCRKRNIDYNVIFSGSDFENIFNYEDKTYQRYAKNSITEIIRSYDELIEICNKYNSPAFDENSGLYNTELNKLIRSFDKNYFKSKALILCCGSHSSSIEPYDVEYISIENKTLLICLNEPQEGFAAIITPITMIIEVNKKSISMVKGTKIIQ